MLFKAAVINIFHINTGSSQLYVKGVVSIPQRIITILETKTELNRVDGRLVAKNRIQMNANIVPCQLDV